MRIGILSTLLWDGIMRHKVLKRSKKKNRKKIKTKTYSKKNGHGKETYPDGEIYDGNFINNLKHGYGESTFITEEFY